MTVLKLAEEHRRQQNTLNDLLLEEVTDLWRQLFGDRPATAADVDDLAAIIGPLIGQYGAAARAVAEDFYRRMRDEAGLTDRFEVPVVDLPPDEQIKTTIGWAVNPDRKRRDDPGGDLLDLDDPKLGERQLDDLTGAAGRLARDPGRSTIERAIDEDPASVGWARVTGPHPCAFCTTLASRGFTYVSRDSALYVAGTRERYHDRCQCTAVPGWRKGKNRLPDESRQARGLWYDYAAYFSGGDAINALDRALRAIRAGRDPQSAVFDGPANDPSRYRRRMSHDRATVEKWRKAAEKRDLGAKAAKPDVASDVRFAPSSSPAEPAA